MIPSGSVTRPGQSANTPAAHKYDRTLPAPRRLLVALCSAEAHNVAMNSTAPRMSLEAGSDFSDMLSCLLCGNTGSDERDSRGKFVAKDDLEPDAAGNAICGNQRLCRERVADLAAEHAAWAEASPIGCPCAICRHS